MDGILFFFWVYASKVWRFDRKKKTQLHMGRTRPNAAIRNLIDMSILNWFLKKKNLKNQFPKRHQKSLLFLLKIIILNSFGPFSLVLQRLAPRDLIQSLSNLIHVYQTDGRCAICQLVCMRHRMQASEGVKVGWSCQGFATNGLVLPPRSALIYMKSASF